MCLLGALWNWDVNARDKTIQLEGISAPDLSTMEATGRKSKVRSGMASARFRLVSEDSQPQTVARSHSSAADQHCHFSCPHAHPPDIV